MCRISHGGPVQKVLADDSKTAAFEMERLGLLTEAVLSTTGRYAQLLSKLRVVP
jgi:hypothetical protein